MTRRLCIYCQTNPPNSQEHIVPTWMVDFLKEDPRGVQFPLMGTLAENGLTRAVRGKRTKRGQHTIEFTTKICKQCNEGWINDIDRLVQTHVKDMMAGKRVELDLKAQEDIATWAMKMAITARFAHITPQYVEREWTDWLYQNHSPLPLWHVWIGRYVGKEPFWYRGDDVSLGGPQPGSSGPNPGGPRPIWDHGVNMTLVVGYLVVQLLGYPGDSVWTGPPRAPVAEIWPTAGQVSWPPFFYINDESLGPFATFLIPK